MFECPAVTICCLEVSVRNIVVKISYDDVLSHSLWRRKMTFLKLNIKDHSMKRGVRQGCILSTLIFNLYSEKIFTEALENPDYGIFLTG